MLRIVPRCSTKRCLCAKPYSGTSCQISPQRLTHSGRWNIEYGNTDDELFSTKLAGHGGCFVQNYLWVFGGFNLNQAFGNLLQYNFTDNSWKNIASDKRPPPRYYHTVRVICFLLLQFEYCV